MVDSGTSPTGVVVAADHGVGTEAPRNESEPGAGQNFRPAILAGISIVIAFFGIFGAWAAFVPLNSAAVAPGTVSVDSNRKTIQHLEGGIVDQILVKDGDVVKAGQPLIRLDVTRSKATRALLQGRLIAARALQARLIAQRDGANEILFPHSLLSQRDDPRVEEAIKGQRSIFQAQAEALKSQVAIQKQRIAQLAEEILGLEGQIRAEETQIKLIRDELDDIRTLVDKGIARKPRLLALQREAAKIEGSRSQNRARIARAKQSIGETNLRILDLRTVMVNEAVGKLREVQAEQIDLAERIAAADDVLKRTVIIAPLAGTVVGLQIHTAGGVIAPGEALLNIVPSGDRLIIEAQVDPLDIDVVQPGLEAQVRLTPFSARSSVPIAGRVMSVSADRLTEERSGRAYYLARVELDKDVDKVLDGATLYPGMPAEVMIVTGERTALAYLFKPIYAGLNSAFRED